MSCVCISVGSPFPGDFPSKDGSVLELGPEGDLYLMIQCHDVSASELSAFQTGFNHYAYFQTCRSGPTIAALVFKFPAPIGYWDVVHHAGLYHDDRASKFLKASVNRLMVYLLDGETVRSIISTELQQGAAAAFRETVARQIMEPVTQASYNTAVDTLFRMSPEEIFRAGKRFRHWTVS